MSGYILRNFEGGKVKKKNIYSTKILTNALKKNNTLLTFFTIRIVRHFRINKHSSINFTLPPPFQVNDLFNNHSDIKLVLHRYGC